MDKIKTIKQKISERDKKQTNIRSQSNIYEAIEELFERIEKLEK